VAALGDLGVESLYLHQARALDAARRGENIVLSTPTASGKTLVYQLPVFERILREPDARAICLFPLKALEQDQLRGVLSLAGRLAAHAGGPPPTAAIYDGDTSAHHRKKIREHPPHLLITNPDMLHAAILAFHGRWERFFRELRFIGGRLHTYRGVFGSHMAHVLRRLLRVARFYGATPQVIACSATIDNPGELAAALTGLPFTVIDDDGSPGAERHFLFVNPVGSPYTAAARIFRQAVRAGYKTIAFTKARKITELIHAWTLQGDPALASRISAYRSGYLPEERREIEGRLKSGDLWGVISTSALEMGIDIGELDVCVLVGYPGSIVNTWQRAGRVGRAGRPCAIVLVAQPDALDQYFVHHPSDFFGRGYERAVVDPGNLEITDPPSAPRPRCRSGARAIYRRVRPPDRPAEEREAPAPAGDRVVRGAGRPHRDVDIRGVGGASRSWTRKPGKG
jgi:DEAD/DEAH box helicase domain-containing protein